MVFCSQRGCYCSHGIRLWWHHLRCHSAALERTVGDILVQQDEGDAPCVALPSNTPGFSSATYELRFHELKDMVHQVICITRQAK